MKTLRTNQGNPTVQKDDDGVTFFAQFPASGQPLFNQNSSGLLPASPLKEVASAAGPFLLGATVIDRELLALC
jgi:hypothetical protein